MLEKITKTQADEASRAVLKRLASGENTNVLVNPYWACNISTQTVPKKALLLRIKERVDTRLSFQTNSVFAVDRSVESITQALLYQINRCVDEINEDGGV